MVSTGGYAIVPAQIPDTCDVVHGEKEKRLREGRTNSETRCGYMEAKSSAKLSPPESGTTRSNDWK